MDFTGYFFISLFTISTALPTGKGWMMSIEPYPTMEICNTVMRSNQENISEGLRRYLYPSLVLIEEIRCLPYEEVVKRNNKIWDSKERGDGQASET